MTLTDEDADAIRILIKRYNEARVGDQDWISEQQKETLDQIWERLMA